MPSRSGWNSTATRMPMLAASCSQPIRLDSICQPSSMSTMTAAYGTVNAGVCGRHTVVQL